MHLLRYIKFDGLQGRAPKLKKMPPQQLQPSKEKFRRQAEHSITNSKTGKVTVRIGYFTEEDMKTTLSYSEYLTLIHTLCSEHGCNIEKSQLSLDLGLRWAAPTRQRIKAVKAYYRKMHKNHPDRKFIRTLDLSTTKKIDTCLPACTGVIQGSISFLAVFAALLTPKCLPC